MKKTTTYILFFSIFFFSCSIDNKVDCNNIDIPTSQKQIANKGPCERVINLSESFLSCENSSDTLDFFESGGEIPTFYLSYHTQDILNIKKSRYITIDTVYYTYIDRLHLMRGLYFLEKDIDFLGVSQWMEDSDAHENMKYKVPVSHRISFNLDIKSVSPKLNKIFISDTLSRFSGLSTYEDLDFKGAFEDFEDSLTIDDLQQNISYFYLDESKWEEKKQLNYWHSLIESSFNFFKNDSLEYSECGFSEFFYETEVFLVIQGKVRNKNFRKIFSTPTRSLVGAMCPNQEMVILIE